MSSPLTERRLAENEVIFRQYNESVQKGFDELKKVAKEEDQEDTVTISDTPLEFYCECADENCDKRVTLSPSRYAQIHKRRDVFIVLCGHETTSIEKVISTEGNYCIIEKYVDPPATASHLNPTKVHNS